MSSLTRRTPEFGSDAEYASVWLPESVLALVRVPPVTLALGRALSASVSCAPYSCRLGFTPLPNVQPWALSSFAQ
jgi:hypothetical protein